MIALNGMHNQSYLYKKTEYLIKVEKWANSIQIAIFLDIIRSVVENTCDNM